MSQKTKSQESRVWVNQENPDIWNGLSRENRVQEMKRNIVQGKDI